MTEDKVVIICSPVVTDAGMQRYIVPGSVTGKCSLCGCAIWLSPSTQRMMRQEQVDLVCNRCLLPSSDDIKPMPQRFGQAVEILNYLRRQ